MAESKAASLSQASTFGLQSIIGADLSFGSLEYNVEVAFIVCLAPVQSELKGKCMHGHSSRVLKISNI